MVNSIRNRDILNSLEDWYNNKVLGDNPGEIKSKKRRDFLKKTAFGTLVLCAGLPKTAMTKGTLDNSLFPSIINVGIRNQLGYGEDADCLINKINALNEAYNTYLGLSKEECSTQSNNEDGIFYNRIAMTPKDRVLELESSFVPRDKYINISLLERDKNEQIQVKLTEDGILSSFYCLKDVKTVDLKNEYSGIVKKLVS
jgi:hypothetical protein